MRHKLFYTDTIKQHLEKTKYSTLDELKSITGTTVSMTIFRMLKEADYISSCSHRGKYYSLMHCAEFDHLGLWQPDGILFSKFGNLIDTVEHLVCNSEIGYTSTELRTVLSVKVKEPLMQLWVETKLARQECDGVYVYTSAEAARKRQQLLLRHQRANQDISSSSVDQKVKAAIVLFYSILDEKQRRLYAGLESIKLGQRGGDATIARLLGVDQHTVAKGRKELLESDIEIGRVRRVGAGRTTVEKKLRK
ncbi:MAG: hypothetical protein JW915_00280 [Chitinispirillaceae bacterium]|nr:hypothetical protein [Chitinispirillaceae bacterium]